MTQPIESSFLKPLWRRMALVAFCAAWALWELYNGQTFWAGIAGLVTVYGAWIYLINYSQPPSGNDNTKKRP